MKIKYLKLKNWLLVSLAGLLGINVSCIGGMEYGCPEADFNVKGKVTDPDGIPIPGIAVTMDYQQVTTDENGLYAVSSNNLQGNVNQFNVIFSDIDSNENGLYKNDTVPVVFQLSELTGGDGHWYEGSATKTVDVTLQPAGK